MSLGSSWLLVDDFNRPEWQYRYNHTQGYLFYYKITKMVFIYESKAQIILGFNTFGFVFERNKNGNDGGTRKAWGIIHTNASNKSLYKKMYKYVKLTKKKTNNI